MSKNNNYKKLFKMDEFGRKFYCKHARLNQLRSDKKQAKRKVRREFKKSDGEVKEFIVREDTLTRVKDIVPAFPIECMVRVFTPDGSDELFGYCYWDGKALIPHDGDCYSLEDEIVQWEEYPVYNGTKYLVYWLNVDWVK